MREWFRLHGHGGRINMAKHPLIIAALLLVTTTFVEGGPLGKDHRIKSQVGEARKKVTDDLKDIFDVSVKLGESMKSIVDQLESGIKKLEKTHKISDMDMKSLTNMQLPQLNVSLINAIVNDISQADTNKTKEPTALVPTKNKEHGQTNKPHKPIKTSASIFEKRINPAQEQDNTLLEELKRISAVQAFRNKRSKLQSKLENKNNEESEDTKQFLDPKTTEQALDKSIQGMHNLKSKMDSVMNELEKQLDEGGRKQLTLFTNNVTHFFDIVDDTFDNKALNKQVKATWKVFNDTIQQMKLNSERFKKEMDSLFSKHNATIIVTKQIREKLMKRVIKPENAKSLQKMQEFLDDIKATFDPSMLDAEFSTINTTMQKLKGEMTEFFDEFMKILQNSGENKSLIPRAVNIVDSKGLNSNVQNTVKNTSDVLNSAKVEAAFLDLSNRIRIMSECFSKQVEKLAHKLKITSKAGRDGENIKKVQTNGYLEPQRQQKREKQYKVMTAMEKEGIRQNFRRIALKLLDLKTKINTSVMSVGQEIKNLSIVKKSITAEMVSSDETAWEQFKNQFSKEEMDDVFHQLYKDMKIVQHDMNEKLSKLDSNLKLSSSKTTSSSLDRRTRDVAVSDMKTMDAKFSKLDNEISETLEKFETSINCFKELVKGFKRESNVQGVNTRTIVKDQKHEIKLPEKTLSRLTDILKNHSTENLQTVLETIGRKISNISEKFDSIIQTLKDEIKNKLSKQEHENSIEVRRGNTKRADEREAETSKFRESADPTFAPSKLSKPQKYKEIGIPKDIPLHPSASKISAGLIHDLQLLIDKVNQHKVIAEHNLKKWEENAEADFEAAVNDAKNVVHTAENAVHTAENSVHTAEKGTATLQQLIVQSAKEGKKSRRKREATTVNEEVNNILTIFEDIVESIQPDVIKKYIEQSNKSLEELERKMMKGLKEVLKYLDECEAKHKDVSSDDIVARDIRSVNNSTDFIGTLERIFDEESVDAEFEDLWDEYKSIAKDMETCAKELMKGFDEMKNGTNEGSYVKRQEAQVVESDVIKILKKIKYIIDPTNIKVQFENLNADIKQVSDEVDTGLLKLKSSFSNANQS